MSEKRVFAALLSSFLLFIFAFSVNADVSLPDGAVKGLPEKLTAMDSNGRSVDSATGEYFFHVEDMEFGEVYTKEIQLMNLCDDKAYHIYFYVEPKPETKNGEIDLENGCVCTFFLDGEEFYRGSVTGAGNIDLTREVKDLGYYEPGDAHRLTCSIAWVDTANNYFIDEGHRLVDKTGTWILTPRSGEGSIYGEIEFKWIFSAVQDEEYIPPDTGLLAADGTFLICAIIVVTVMIVIMAVLLLTKKKKGKRKAAPEGVNTSE